MFLTLQISRTVAWPLHAVYCQTQDTRWLGDVLYAFSHSFQYFHLTTIFLLFVPLSVATPLQPSSMNAREFLITLTSHCLNGRYSSPLRALTVTCFSSSSRFDSSGAKKIVTVFWIIVILRLCCYLISHAPYFDPCFFLLKYNVPSVSTVVIKCLPLFTDVQFLNTPVFSYYTISLHLQCHT